MDDSLRLTQGDAMPTEIAVGQISLADDFIIFFTEAPGTPDNAEFTSVTLLLIN